MAVIITARYWSAHTSEKPHVSRKDGGHIIIAPNRIVTHRWQLTRAEACELVKLSMIVGEAMLKGLKKQGIPIERINFQDNGNWAIGPKKRQHMHLHLYGRAKDSRHQKRGEALHFPDKCTQFWKKLEPLNEKDVIAISREINILLKKKKYQSW